MQYTGKLSTRQYAEVYNEARARGQPNGYAIRRRSTQTVLAIMSSKEELESYKKQITCIIPEEDIEELGYRPITGGKNNGRSNSSKNHKRTGTGVRKNRN